MEILSGLLKLASSEGGQAALVRLFKDSDITPKKVADAVAALPPVKDTEETNG